jgi:hypothetical protein
MEKFFISNSQEPIVNHALYFSNSRLPNVSDHGGVWTKSLACKCIGRHAKTIHHLPTHNRGRVRPDEHIQAEQACP